MTEDYNYTFKKVRCIVERYWNIKKAVNEYRMQKKSHTTEQGPRPQGVVSDPTRREAEINLLEVPYITVKGVKIRQPEKWIECINDVSRELDYSDWVVLMTMCDNKSREDAAEQAHLSLTAYYNRRREILSIIAIKATERSLIKTGEKW